MSEEVKTEEKATEIVEREEMFGISEKRDEDQIQKELMGELVSTMIYRFDVSGREVVGLSWVGVKEAARHHGGIIVEEPKITEDEEKYTVLVKAKDVYNNIEMWGTSQQKKIMDTKYGKKEDIFALQKALSKAQRNAIRQLLPEKYITMILDRFAKGEKLPEKKKSGLSKLFGKKNEENSSEPAQEWVDYKQSPLAQQILKACEETTDTHDLFNILLAQGFAKDTIKTVLNLMMKDGLLAEENNKLRAVV